MTFPEKLESEAARYKVTHVLNEPTVSIFRVVCRKRRQAVISSEKSVTFCETARRHPRREDYL
jgi:hypothetical protein